MVNLIYIHCIYNLLLEMTCKELAIDQFKMSLVCRFITYLFNPTIEIQHGVKSESNYVIFNAFSHLNKSFLGKSLEKYNFQPFNIDKVIEILNFAIKVVIFYLCLSRLHFMFFCLFCFLVIFRSSITYSARC